MAATLTSIGSRTSTMRVPTPTLPTTTILSSTILLFITQYSYHLCKSTTLYLLTSIYSSLPLCVIHSFQSIFLYLQYFYLQYISTSKRYHSIYRTTHSLSNTHRYSLSPHSLSASLHHRHSQVGTTTISELPHEMLQNIISFLSVQEVASNSFVNSHWQKLCSELLSNHETWKSQCLYEFPVMKYTHAASQCQWLNDLDACEYLLSNPENSMKRRMSSHESPCNRSDMNSSTGTYYGLQWYNVYKCLRHAERLGESVFNGYELLNCRVHLNVKSKEHAINHQRNNDNIDEQRNDSRGSSSLHTPLHLVTQDVHYAKQAETLLRGLYCSLPTHMIHLLASSNDDHAAAASNNSGSRSNRRHTHNNIIVLFSRLIAKRSYYTHIQWIEKLMLPYILLLDISILTTSRTAEIELSHKNTLLRSVSLAPIDDTLYNSRPILPIFLLSHFIDSLKLLQKPQRLSAAKYDKFIRSLPAMLHQFAQRIPIAYESVSQSQRLILKRWLQYGEANQQHQHHPPTPLQIPIAGARAGD